MVEKENLLLLPETYKDGETVKKLMEEIEILKIEIEEIYFTLGEKYRILDELENNL